jgi:hypothetical protein
MASRVAKCIPPGVRIPAGESRYGNAPVTASLPDEVLDFFFECGLIDINSRLKKALHPPAGGCKAFFKLK